MKVPPLPSIAAVVACAALSACRSAPSPPPDSIEATVAPGGLDVEGDAQPFARPTWTVGAPLGALPFPTAGAPAPGGPAGAGNPADPNAPGGAPIAGGLPAPTARPAAAVAAAGPPATDPAIVGLMGAVDPNRLSADVRTLVAFGTRHALSSPEGGTRGVGAARQWLRAAFEAIGRSSVSQIVASDEPFPLSFAGRSTEQKNVVATLTGIGAVKRFVYVVAHYDSRVGAIEDGASDAPGAADDASGTAALLELARVLGMRQWDATVRLLATAAQEEGLFGAKHHAAHVRAMGLPIVAVLNNDVVGGAAGEGGARQPARVRVFSAGDDGGPSRRLARYAAVIAARYASALGAPAGALAVESVPQADPAGRVGDHQAFTEAGFPAIRLIDAVEDVRHQHDPSDTADRLDAAYHAAVVRLDVALAANLALAPVGEIAAPRLVADSSAPGRYRVSWDPLSDPTVAGYYIGWRRAGDPLYVAVAWSPTTEVVLDGLPGGAGEDVRVAVAASDDLGHLGVFGGEAGR